MPQHQPILPVFGTILGGHHIRPRSVLTCCGYHCGWLPMAGVWGPSEAILAAGVRAVVTLWHGHHSQHIPVFLEDCQTASLLWGALVIAGRVVLYLLFPRSSAREGVLSSKCVALSSSIAICGLVPSNSHLMRIFLMVCTCLSINPWPLGWYGLLVVNLNPYCAAKFLYSCAMNCFPLSQMISSTLPYSEMIDSRAEITFLLDIDGNSLNTGDFE